MRGVHLIGSIAVLVVCAQGCGPLPTVGFGVRSTWRTREAPAARAVELLTGVTVGWAAARRGAQPTAIGDDRAYERGTSAHAFRQAELPCADVQLCRWEHDERHAALLREGLREGLRPSDLPEGVLR